MKKILLSLVYGLGALTLLASLFVSARVKSAKAKIEANWQEQPFPAPVLKPTTTLEVIPLYEAAGDGADFVIGQGVSYLVRTDAATILFDVGNNLQDAPVAPALQNMQTVGINWDEIDHIVISHPHPDHLGGIDAWQHRTVSFGNINVPEGLGNRQIFVPAPVRFKGAIHATIPSLPAPDVATTGVLSYLEAFPFLLFEPKGGEQALVVNVAGDGLVLITGCGHPTLEQMVKRTEALYGLPVVGVIGGLHYATESTEELQQHITFLQDRQLKIVALSPHDSGPEAFAAFESAFTESYIPIRVGEPIRVP